MSALELAIMFLHQNASCSWHSRPEQLDSVEIMENEAQEYEKATQQQGESEALYRAYHLTASRFKSVLSRRVNFESLAKTLHSTKVVQTAAMKYGLIEEPVAAEMYSNFLGAA